MTTVLTALCPTVTNAIPLLQQEWKFAQTVQVIICLMEILAQPVISSAVSSVKIQPTVRNVTMVMPHFPMVNVNVVAIMKSRAQMEAARIVTYLDVLHAKKWMAAFTLLIA